MQIEIEKKYNLTKEDYKIIRENCDFIKEVKLKDYYLDKDMILTKNGYLLRLRNGKYQLKIAKFNPETRVLNSEEYENEDEINKLLEKFNISTDDVSGTIFVDTLREKYEYKYEGNKINIDVEQYQYGTRYEIEIVYQESDNSKNRDELETKLNEVIENFRNKLGLVSESNINTSKIITCAMYQNIEMYEVLTSNNI